jgi:hypothetical protein
MYFVYNRIYAWIYPKHKIIKDHHGVEYHEWVLYVEVLYIPGHDHHQ